MPFFRSVLNICLWIIAIVFVACQNDVSNKVDEQGKPKASKLANNNTQLDDQTSTEIKKHKQTENKPSIPSHVEHQLKQFKALVAQDNKKGLADLFDNYPIKRANLLIQNDAELIANYHDFFTEKIKESIANVAYNQQDVFFRNGHYSILNGGLWFYETGEILRINIKTDLQKEAAKDNVKAIEQSHHDSTRGWSSSILRFETEKYIVHLYYFKEGGYRYFSWSKPKTTAEKPDLSLSDGMAKTQGSMGGMHYIFSNGAYTYKVLEIKLGTEERNGVYLQVYKGDTMILEQKAIRLIE